MIVFVVTVGISLAITPLVRQLAVREKWLSRATRKGGIHPTMMGGTAVLASTLVALLLLGKTITFTGLASFWVGAIVMFGMGLVDDFAVLSPGVKLSVQVFAALVFLVLLVLEGRHILSLWTPLFFFWLLAITNSLNLFDNMDGLTAGVGAIVGLALASNIFGGSGAAAGIVLLALAGSLAGFLVYNFHPARIFLGDSGSHLVGFSLAALPFYGLSSKPDYPWRELLMPPLLLLLPICDTAYVTFSRLHRGTPIFQGGKDHISHRLLEAGLCERTVALIFYGATILLSLVVWFLAMSLADVAKSAVRF